MADPENLKYKVELSPTFDSLAGSVSDITLRAIEKMGFTTMTEIQAKSIPSLLEGKDVRATAKTGSGKTLAFLIPVVELIEKIQFKPKSGTAVIIISPTRELSMQTYGILTQLAEGRNFTYGITMGGANRSVEASKLARGVAILVATPGRLLDHLQNTSKFMFKRLQALVVDEADRILDVGFEEDMKAILKILPKKRQTMLFSATKDKRTNELASLALKTNILEVDVDSNKTEATVEGLEQSYLVCPTDKRFLVLYTFIKRNLKKKVMIFFSSCMAVKFYYELLNYIDIPVMAIHGRQKQSKRTTTFFEFSNAKHAVLLCTDVAARGWDIPAVDWIMQYDPPDDPKEYIHRVGRTARAGGRGNALIFIREEELGFVYYLKSQRINVESMDILWSKVANIQPQLEKLMKENYMLHMSAKKGFKGYISAYQAHSLKEYFDVDSLDLKKVAKCFGFSTPPHIDLGAHKMRPQHRKKFKKTFNKKKAFLNLSK